MVAWGLDSDWSKYFNKLIFWFIWHLLASKIKNKEVINTNVTNSLKLVKNAIKSGCKNF